MSTNSLCGYATIVAVTLAVGCSQSGPRRNVKVSLDPGQISSQALEQYDADKDGKVSGSELDKCPALKDLLAKIDTSGDKAITGEELAARIQQWQNVGMPRFEIECRVLRNGKPLQDADVKFVPEKFMGKGVPVCSGKTGADGMTTINAQEEVGGVPPGLYRVEITKSGDNIPAKYNTETTFGAEAYNTSHMDPQMFKLSLQY